MKRLVTRDTELGGVPLQAGERGVPRLRLRFPGRRPVRRPRRPRPRPVLGRAAPGLRPGRARLPRRAAGPAAAADRARRPARAAAGPAARASRTTSWSTCRSSAGRGMVALPLAWTPVPVPSAPPPTHRRRRARRPPCPVTVAARRELTADVVELTLDRRRAGALPDWEPGAHIDLELPDGALRQYSLCGRPGTGELRIAVLREDDGRGGSVAVHDSVRVGDRLRIRGPRNHFRLRPAPRPAVRRRRHRDHPAAADDRGGRAPRDGLAAGLPRPGPAAHALRRRARRAARRPGRGVAEPRAAAGST